METLERLGRRIETVAEIRSLVRTMKTLSAVNLRQIEQAAEPIGAFKKTNALGLRTLRDYVPETETPASSSISLLIGAERGLCGRFSDRVADCARSEDRTIVVGRRLSDILATENPEQFEHFSLPSSMVAAPATATAILKTLEGWSPTFTAGIRLVHMTRRGAGLERIEQTIWPIDRRSLRSLIDREWPGRRLPLPFGAPGPLAARLLRQRLEIAIITALHASMAAENAARLAAMQAAEDNIAKTLAALEQTQRLRRQAAITAELSDIRAGFERSKRP